MLVSQIAVLIALVLLLTIPLSHILKRIWHFFRRDSYEREINMLFRFFLNHSSEDELHAWYRVRYILSRRGATNKEIRFVERQISEVDRQLLLSEWHVNREGELTDESVVIED